MHGIMVTSLRKRKLVVLPALLVCAVRRSLSTRPLGFICRIYSETVALPGYRLCYFENSNTTKSRLILYTTVYHGLNSIKQITRARFLFVCLFVVVFFFFLFVFFFFFRFFVFFFFVFFFFPI